MWFVKKKNVRKRCCWNCNIWPNWFTSHQSHYCLYYNGIPEFVRKRTMLTIKLLKQRKIFEISLSDTRIYKKWQTSAIIREISDSNLETGRNGSKSGVSWIIWKSWQPCNLRSPGEWRRGQSTHTTYSSTGVIIKCHIKYKISRQFPREE